MSVSLNSLLPIIYDNSSVLILGSMPSKISLEKQQYYANPRNQFWKLIYSIFDEELDQQYEKKIDFLRSKRIAIWDVIKECPREGSLDSTIKDEQPNDFNDLLKQYPNIRLIVFNGGLAEKSFWSKVHLGDGVDDRVKFIRVPSSSPANAIKFEKKKVEWKAIKSYIDEQRTQSQ